MTGRALEVAGTIQADRMAACDQIITPRIGKEAGSNRVRQ